MRESSEPRRSRAAGFRWACRAGRRSSRVDHDAAHRVDEVVTLLLDEVRAENDRKPPERRKLYLLLLRRLLAGAANPERIHVGAEALGGAPRAAQEPLGRRLGLHEREDPLAYSLTAERVENVRTAPRPGSPPLRGARARAALQACRPGRSSGARLQRGRPGRPCPRGAAAGARPARGRPGSPRRRRRGSVRERLAHPHARELEDSVVEALEMLHVDGRDHVDAGLEHLVDVLVALRVSRSRRVRVRELVDERELRRPPDQRVRIELVELEEPCPAFRRATASNPSASTVVSGRSCG